MKDKPTSLILAADQWITYNGKRIHWFIGDGINYGKNNMWWAWGAYYDEFGKCYPYRMVAKFNSKTRKLSEIKVCPDPSTFQPKSLIYWDEKTYRLLTE